MRCLTGLAFAEAVVVYPLTLSQGPGDQGRNRHTLPSLGRLSVCLSAFSSSPLRSLRLGCLRPRLSSCRRPRPPPGKATSAKARVEGWRATSTLPWPPSQPTHPPRASTPHVPQPAASQQAGSASQESKVSQEQGTSLESTPSTPSPGPVPPDLPHTSTKSDASPALLR